MGGLIQTNPTPLTDFSQDRTHDCHHSFAAHEFIKYQIEVDADEPDSRLALLHKNVKKYGALLKTVAPGTDLSGLLVRKKLRFIPTGPESNR